MSDAGEPREAEELGADSCQLDAGPKLSGYEILDQVEAFVRRFVAFPSEDGLVAAVLWIAHTWAMESWENTPRIAFLSPEPGSGKSRALEVMELLVPNPVHAVNVTPAYLFRKVSDPAGAPTILYDEIDTVFGVAAKGNEDVRGMLNAGSRRGAVAGRCVKRNDVNVTEDLPAYCAVALAGLNDLPDTIMSRSIVIRMRRRGPNENVEPFRRRVNEAEGFAVRDVLAEWITCNADALLGAWPLLPKGIEDRNGDCWEPLLAIADLAGGRWPERARHAAVALVAANQELAQETLGISLLADLRQLFGLFELQHVPSEVLVDMLLELEESPWSDLPGGVMDARRLAKMLGKYGVRSKNIRVASGRVLKGYSRDELEDLWDRYLPQLEPPASATGATPDDDVIDVTEEYPAECLQCGRQLDDESGKCQRCPPKSGNPRKIYRIVRNPE